MTCIAQIDQLLI